MVLAAAMVASSVANMSIFCQAVCNKLSFVLFCFVGGAICNSGCIYFHLSKGGLVLINYINNRSQIDNIFIY